MATARKEVILEGAEAVYHCVSKCVRRAYLCGIDPYTGDDHTHRKEWIKSRIRELASVFAVEVSAYAIMSNHFHIILRTRPDMAEDWPDREVAERWLKLFSKSRPVEDDKTPPQSEVKLLIGDPERMRELRQRISSLSWFMRSLNEYVSRRANQEDECKGRFWEGRFTCQTLLDESAVLACMAFVDLNPVRSGLVERLEDIDHTSMQERIELRRDSSGSAAWLCPIGDESPDGGKGLLPIMLDQYIALIDWTGKQLRLDKPDTVPDHLAILLERLEINKDRWVETVVNYGRLFHRVAGRPESIANTARQAGITWMAGLTAGRQCFTPSKK